MSSIDTLLIVLAIVYLVECAAWVPRDAVPFRQGLFGRWRHAPPSEWGGHDRSAFVFSGPLPPLPPLILSEEWPIAIGDDGVSRLPPAEARLFPWESLRELRVDGRALLAKGDRVAEFLSPLVAHEVGGLLERLAALPPERRGPEIRSAVRASLDAEGARRRYAEYRRAARMLAISTNGLAVLLFAVVPAMFHVPFLAERWFWVLLVALAVWPLVIVDFAHAHRALFPRLKRRRHVATMAASPLGALRARDVVARDALALFHPLAAARTLLDAPRFEELARKALAEARFPVPAAAPRAGEEGWRALLGEEIERFLRHEGLDPQALLAPPPREGPESLAYCERCRSQYTLREGTCHACGGRALRAYEDGAGRPVSPFPAPAARKPRTVSGSRKRSR